MGPNNAGKSSLLQGIQFAVSVAQSLKLDGVSKWRNDAISGTLSTEQLIYTPLRDVQALAPHGKLTQDHSKAIHAEFKDDEGQINLTVAKGKNKNISIKMSGEALGKKLENYEQPYSIVAPGLAGIPAFEEYKSAGLVRRAAARGDANSVFRNVLLDLSQDQTSWSIFQDQLHEIFPDVDISVYFNQEADETISAYVKREGSNLPIDSSGTGILQAIQVLAYVGVYRPSLLILDEPDSHLHPNNQRKLATLLVKLATELDFQILLSTHSRSFIDALHENDADITWLASGQIQDSEFDRIDALLELGALDAADRLNHGKVPFVVITEDENHKALRTLLDSSGLTTLKYDIWSYKGCTNLKSAVAIAKFIHDKAPGTRVIIHRDRDYVDEIELTDFVTEMRATGALPFITDGTDIESHYLNIHHLREVFPEIDISDLDSILAQATLETRDLSVKMLINERVEFSKRQKSAGVKNTPSAGTVASESHTQFDKNPERYRHGKKTLKATRRLIQERFGLNRPLEISTPALRCVQISDYVGKHMGT